MAATALLRDETCYHSDTLAPLRAKLPEAGPYLVLQNCDAYTPEQHAVWSELVRRRMPQLRDHAAREYLDGFQKIGLREDRIPDLAAITARLRPETGWNSTPVSGFMPGTAFFEMLASRYFPTTTWIRSREVMEYTPEPDIFHDVFGHIPMHAHPVFADFLQEYGRVCMKFLDNADALEKLGRIFWFTVEFGVMRQDGTVKIYGSGLISSHGESTKLIEGLANGTGPEIRDFDTDSVMDTVVKVDEMQKVLYAIASFDQIYKALGDAERKLR